jgi:hypothetical protein
MHLSRRHKAIFFDQHTMPPGDGNRSKDAWEAEDQVLSVDASGLPLTIQEPSRWFLG